MEKVLKQFAEEYEIDTENMAIKDGKQKAVSNPLIFIFVGDKVQDGVEIIKHQLCKKWKSSEEVLSFTVASAENTGEESKFNLSLPYPKESKEALREQLYKEFCHNEEKLMEYAKGIKALRNKVLEQGKKYNSCEKITLSFVTRADDPMNAILIPIALLAKTKLEEAFKMVSLELCIMLEEKDDPGQNAAMSIAFLKEIEHAQSKEFIFDEEIDAQGDGVKIAVTNEGRQIFDSVYILEDRNEKGYMLPNSTVQNYEVLTYIYLLKNRTLEGNSYDEQNPRYEEGSFRRGIRNTSENFSYISAGLSKVKRPDCEIAFTVLKSFYDLLLNQMRQLSHIEIEKKKEILSINSLDLEETVNRFLANRQSLDEMMGIMLIEDRVSISELQRMTFQQIEKRLYGEGCSQFFQGNFREVLFQNIKNEQIKDKTKKRIQCDIIENVNYGIFSAYNWTAEEEVLKEIRAMRRSLQLEVEHKNREIEELYNKRIDFSMQYALPFFQKKAIEKAKKELIESIYWRKLQILKIELKIEILAQQEQALLEIHEEMELYIQKLEEIKERIHYYSDESNDVTEESQNMYIYYSTIVSEIAKELEKEHGRFFYFEEGFIGNVYLTLKEGKGSFLDRVVQVCKRSILTRKEFTQSFEEELHQRANVSAEYGNDKVLSRKELFEKLYQRIEEQSIAHVYLTGVHIENRYEEAYYFGDYESNFIKFAFQYNGMGRSRKLGCIHEDRKNGIEKLTLMGGFYLSQLMYYKNCLKYYEIYKDKGYKLHGI